MCLRCLGLASQHLGTRLAVASYPGIVDCVDSCTDHCGLCLWCICESHCTLLVFHPLWGDGCVRFFGCGGCEEVGLCGGILVCGMGNVGVSDTSLLHNCVHHCWSKQQPLHYLPASPSSTFLIISCTTSLHAVTHCFLPLTSSMTVAAAVLFAAFDSFNFAPHFLRTLPNYLAQVHRLCFARMTTHVLINPTQLSAPHFLLVCELLHRGVWLLWCQTIGNHT